MGLQKETEQRLKELRRRKLQHIQLGNKLSEINKEIRYYSNVLKLINKVTTNESIHSIDTVTLKRV